MGHTHDIRLPDAGLQHLEDVVVDAVDHCARLGQQDDLVVVLDLAGAHHRLLPVDDGQPRVLEGEKDCRLGEIDSKPELADTVLVEGRLYLAHRSSVQTGLGADRSLQSGVATDGVLGVVHVRELETMGFGRRPEVPHPGPALTGHQCPALALVERPVADLGGGGVADVGGFEEQDRTEVENSSSIIRTRSSRYRRSRSKSTLFSQSTPITPGAGLVATGNSSIAFSLPVVLIEFRTRRPVRSPGTSSRGRIDTSAAAAAGGPGSRAI